MAQQPRHTANPQHLDEAGHAQDGQPADVRRFLPVDEVHHDGEDVRLEYHHGHEERVEQEPPVMEATPLLLEGEEADGQLDDEVYAEGVLGKLEDQRCGEPRRGLIQVRVEGEPDSVEEDHGQGHRLEEPMLRDGLRDAPPVVEADHVVLRPDQRLPGPQFHRLRVGEDVLHGALRGRDAQAPARYADPQILRGMLRVPRRHHQAVRLAATLPPP
mmetsp:Transcript_76956/g.222491  ORF Transcript_76956/g.222491 Transcript_76956/m.222491 type:complete len:215 (-) Transcript_76956:871-1515(-)